MHFGRLDYVYTAKRQSDFTQAARTETLSSVRSVLLCVCVMGACVVTAARLISYRNPVSSSIKCR